MAILNSNGIKFSNVKLPDKVLGIGKWSNEPYKDKNRNRNASKYSTTEINEPIHKFINAIDIDWNGALWPEIVPEQLPQSINTTSDIILALSYIHSCVNDNLDAYQTVIDVINNFSDDMHDAQEEISTITSNQNNLVADHEELYSIITQIANKVNELTECITSFHNEAEIELLDIFNYSKDYLTFTALEDTTFTFTTNELQYSLDDGASWNTLSADTTSPTVTAGNKILWKQTGLTPTSSGIGTFSSTGNFNVRGNIMSLLYGDNFVGQTDLTGYDYAFKNLFINNTKLVNAKNLILPAITLVIDCYNSMFQDCTALTTAPELPATTLASGCYLHMFQGCTSLTTAPELPATTLAYYCYSNMFQGCTSLTTAPELPATTLTEGCYNSMFATCIALVTAPELPATTLASYCYGGMFMGCTSLTTAPELPATTLANWCYYEIFRDCTSLNYIKCLATDISASNCTSNWVDGVAATGTFVKNASMSSWTTGTDGIPSKWTVQDVA